MLKNNGVDVKEVWGGCQRGMEWILSKNEVDITEKWSWINMAHILKVDLYINILHNTK